MRMTRRLRTDRMLRRVRETRTAELLRAAGEEVAAKVRAGCKPQCPGAFHYHTAVGHTCEATEAAYERGDWEPQPRAEWTPTPKRLRKSTPRGVPRMRVRAQRNNREYRDALIARTVQLYGQLQTVNQILEAHGLPTRSTDPNGATQP